MTDYYESLGGIMGELEGDVSEIETMILNGKCEKGNRYLREAVTAINRALSSLSDALFEVTTTVIDDDEDYDS